MSEQQDDAYSEACEEIEKLKAKVARLQNTLYESNQIYKEQRTKIERLKRIIHRLANALDMEGGNDELVEAARREATKDE